MPEIAVTAPPQLHHGLGHDPRAAKLQPLLKELHQFFTSFRDGDGARLDAVSPVDGQAYNVLEAIRHAERAVGIFGSLRLDAEKPVPTKVWTDALSQLNQIDADATSLRNLVQQVSNDSRPLKALTGSTLSVRDTGEQPYTLTTSLTALVSNADGLLQATSSLAPVPRTKGGAPTISEAAAIAADGKSALEALKAAELAQREARETLEQAKARLAEVDQTRAKVDGVLQSTEAQATERLEALQSSTAQISNYNSESAENSGAIRSRLEDITRLATSAETIAKDLTGYQATLDQVRKRVEELQAVSDRTVATQIGQRDEVKALIEQAEKMLSGATVAGLSTAFDLERKQLDETLKGAGRSFVFGVVALSVASAFVLVYVLNVEFVPGGPLGFIIKAKSGEPHEIYLSGVLARSIILIGPLWFTQFAASRYRQLFDLRQQYAHKYNVAYSADGFTKAAEKYRDDITLWVFETIGRNPVPPRRFGRSMDDPPHSPGDGSDVMSFGERLLSTIVGRGRSRPKPKPEGS